MKFDFKAFSFIVAVAVALMAVTGMFESDPVEAQISGASGWTVYSMFDDTTLTTADDQVIAIGTYTHGGHQAAADSTFYWKGILLIIDPTVQADSSWTLDIYRDGSYVAQDIPLWRGGTWWFPIYCDSARVTCGDAGKHYVAGVY